MPKLKIDGREIEVPKGTKVIDAAERLGIMIPRFCYHQALGAIGACRVCAVKFVEGPVKGIRMSCMTDAVDEMVVSTVDPEAMEFRKFVIECLMLNHPLDCPVCDEGGHCLLQDETVSGGHGIRRYLGKKRTYRDQDLGEFVQHEMNRCIHCLRCRRFYQEFAGYRDLGALQTASRTYFGRFEDGPLESPFAGNLIDVCPTGVYTDKAVRFRARRWDLERAPSVCPHCSLGCNTTGSARYREMMRQEGRLNREVNGFFICDRGRFGFDYGNHPDRPRSGRVGGREVPREEAVREAARELARIEKEHGLAAIACVGSPRSSLETQAALARFCRLRGWPDPRFFLDLSTERKVRTAVSRLDERSAASMKGVERADFILALGADPINEAPMLALAMRQAVRKGATVVTIDPRPISLPFDFQHLAVGPGVMEACAGALTKTAVTRDAAELMGEEAVRFLDGLPGDAPLDEPLVARLAQLGEKLAKSRCPVVVCGTDIVRETTPDLAADLALLLARGRDRAGLFYLLPGPNAFGAGLLSTKSAGTPVLDAIGSGAVKALVLVENDPFHRSRTPKRMTRAIESLECLVVLDYLPSHAAERAHFVLPTVTVFEHSPSAFANQEGRAQEAHPIHLGGTPIPQVSRSEHPPRTFLDSVPGGEPRAAPEILEELAQALAGEKPVARGVDLRAWLAEGQPVFSELGSLAERPEGARLLPETAPGIRFSPFYSASSSPVPGQLELLLAEQTFGTEELSGYSRYTQRVEGPPRVFMHPEDAARLGLENGKQVAIGLDGGAIEAELSVCASMASGVLVVPRHRQVRWGDWEEIPAVIPEKSIRQV